MLSVNNSIMGRSSVISAVTTTVYSLRRFGAFPSLLCVQEEEEAAHAGIQAVALKPAVLFTRNINTASKTTPMTPQGQTCQPERNSDISSL